MAKTKKIEGMKFADMDDEQLAEARAILEAQRADLRAEKKELTDRLDATAKQPVIAEEDAAIMRNRVLEIDSALEAIRAEKKKIQEVVDARSQPLGAAANTIGVGGIDSGEAVGRIGG